MESSRVVDPATNNKRRSFTRPAWKPWEDELLINLVKHRGPCNWNRIAEHIPERTGASCRVRWVNHLNPRLNRFPFSGLENRKLLQLHKSLGNRWSTINSFFAGRTDTQIKNQYCYLVRNKCEKSLNPSPNNDSSGILNRGGGGAADSSNLSTVGVSSHFAYSRTEMHSFGDDSSSSCSSVFARDETQSGAHCSNSVESAGPENIHAGQRTFIDFMGVGNSE